MDDWLNVTVRGTAIWPAEETTVQFGGHTLILKPMKRDTEQSIHINLRGTSEIEAQTIINRFLSLLSWIDDQPMENIFGFSGSPVPIPAGRGDRVTAQSRIFPFGRTLETNQKSRLALALFREARTVNSTPYEFLGYFKILNIVWNDRWATINGTRERPIVDGIRTTLPHLKDSRSLQRLRVISQTHTDSAAYLYESGRCAVAHANLSNVVDPDDFGDLRRLSADMCIIKEIAEYLLETHFGQSRSILG